MADPVVERVRVGPSMIQRWPTTTSSRLIHVLPRRGVTDAVAESALRALGQMNVDVSAVRTLRKYWVEGLTDDQLQRLCEKVLANDSIEQVVLGPLAITELDASIEYEFAKVVVPIGELDDEGLMRVSREGTLSLSIEEMKTIQAHFAAVGRDPTDVELERSLKRGANIAATKRSRAASTTRTKMALGISTTCCKETVFDATVQIRQALGETTGA